MRSLDDGQRILGADLRAVSGIEDRRSFSKVIEDLRSAGIFIGASRNEDRGYYEIRTNSDMEHFLRKKRQQLKGEWKLLDELEKKWLAKEATENEVV